MKYRVEYTITGVDDGSFGKQTFEADNDDDAKKKADALIAKLEEECNAKIENRFWHFKFRKTDLVRITQEEISESLFV